MIEGKLIPKGKQYHMGEYTIVEREVLQSEAKFAMTFIEKWGMVSAVPDGEDAAGRQKIRLMTEEEVVNRAFRTAKLAMQEARERGLILHTPSIDELIEFGENK